MNHTKVNTNENMSSPNEEVIDIINANYEFTIDNNLFTENRGDWVMVDFDMKDKEYKKKKFTSITEIL
jgi:hypothetical protein